MSPEKNNDEMRPEYDMRGAVRGRFFAHAQRWAGITTAEGTVTLNALTTGEPRTPKLVIRAPESHVNNLRTTRIAPEVLPRSA
jgi:hypothetical protein